MIKVKDLGKKGKCLIAHNGFKVGAIIKVTETMIQFWAKYWQPI
jgi:hypothetical protein